MVKWLNKDKNQQILVSYFLFSLNKCYYWLLLPFFQMATLYSEQLELLMAVEWCETRVIVATFERNILKCVPGWMWKKALLYEDMSVCFLKSAFTVNMI